MCGGSLGGGFFGGPSGAEIGAAQQENTFAGLARGYAATNYGEQQQALGQMNSLLQGVQGGKLLAGFTPATQAALNTSAINNAAASNANLKRAINTNAAGRGGSSGLMTGQNSAALAGASANVEANLSNQINQNTIANQQVAEQNTQNAIQGYGALAGEYDPNAFEKSAQTANDANFSNYNTIGQQENAAEAAGVGMVSSLALAGATGGASLAAGGMGGGGGVGSSLYGAEGNALAGGSSSFG